MIVIILRSVFRPMLALGHSLVLHEYKGTEAVVVIDKINTKRSLQRLAVTVKDGQVPAVTSEQD